MSYQNPEVWHENVTVRAEQPLTEPPFSSQVHHGGQGMHITMMVSSLDGLILTTLFAW
jgi:hypothetical protein